MESRPLDKSPDKSLEKTLEKSPQESKETEKRSFMKGISNLFSRVSSSSSETTIVHKSRQESKDEAITERKLLSESTSRLSGVEKFGLGPGSGILAEMKALQGKRTSVGAQSKGVALDGTSETSKDSAPFPSVRLKPTGLADSLRSPTDYFPREKSSTSPGPLENTPSSPQSSGGTPGTSPKTFAALKGRPPPPVAPKPRPKSMVGGMETRLSVSESGPRTRTTVYAKETFEVSSTVSSVASIAANRAAFFSGPPLMTPGPTASSNSLAQEKPEGDAEPCSPASADDIVDV
ncbi:hypothetical protein IscW_ISCW019439 [Ixodes scapularis]|uniref:Uncharacterized protein n=1 Tax=Ixodes scapularis TaxID=6945 RepID=B7PTW8_IXOSC|nr:hypothetical protein IscW_ISCW019439 [Ixodes scapularis]